MPPSEAFLCSFGHRDVGRKRKLLKLGSDANDFKLHFSQLSADGRIFSKRQVRNCYHVLKLSIPREAHGTNYF